MAISYVGGQVAGRTNASSALSVNFALTGGSDSVPAAGDLVVVTCVTGSAAGNPAMAVATPAGYTALGQLNQSAVTADTSMNTSYKRMGGTPDTAVTIPGTTNNAWGEAYSIQVFRGVDSTTPMDVAAVSAGGTGTGRPDPGSITPITSGAWVVICGGGAAGAGANYTAPANYTTNFITANGADTTDAMVGSGYWTGWTSGAENPATYTGGTTGANDSWTAYTLALRPEASAAITGTITASVNEADIVAGGKTLIITLTGDKWIAAGAGSFGLVRDDIIGGCDSAQSEATGWDLVPKITQSVEGVIRTSDTVVTITWDAFATYNITAQETITVTVPSVAVVNGVGPVATPTFTIDTASSPVNVTPGTGAAVFTGFAPTVQTPRNVTPGTGQAVFTGFAPTVQTPRNITPGVGQGVFTGFAPSVTIGVNVLPGTGQAVFAGFAPTIQTPRNITPGTGQLVFTGFAPTVDVGEPPAPPPTVTGILATMFYALRRRKTKQVRV